MFRTIKPFLERHSSILLRLGVVGVVLCALPVIGYVAANPKLGFLVIVAVLMPVVAFVIVERIELGLIGILLAAVFVRFRLPTGTASEIVMSLLLCGIVLGLWIVRMAAIDKRISLKPTAVNFPLLAFMVTVIVSLFWDRAFRDPLVSDLGSPFVAYAAATVMVLLPATLLLVANLVEDVRWLQAMVAVFLAEGVVSLVATLDFGPSRAIHRLLFENGLVWANTQGLFSTWNIAIALSLALFNRRLHRGWRLALLAYVAGWIYWGFFQRITWLSGWVPAFAAAGIVAFLRSKKLFLVVMIVAVVGAGRYYWQTSFQSESEESGQTRLAAYKVNWRITSKHLLFGTGPAGYASYYMTYFPAEGMATHSNYIDIIAQTGVVGIFLMGWFWAVQVWSSYKLQRKLQQRGDFAESLAVAVTAGTVGCIVAMALGDWLFPFAYTQGIVGFDAAMINWFFMGSLWALNHSLTAPLSLRTGPEAPL